MNSMAADDLVMQGSKAAWYYIDFTITVNIHMQSGAVIAWSKYDIDGLEQDCSNSSALAMELLQSCTKPLIWYLNVDAATYIEHRSNLEPIIGTP